MKKLIPFLLLFSSLVLSDERLIEQDGQSNSATHAKSIYFDMVDATDAYTAETGLSPTCTILYPSATSYVSCSDTVTEIGTGTYRIRLNSGKEWQELGNGSLYITAAGARPARIKYKVVENEQRFNVGASIIKANSNFGNTNQWSTTGVTVSADAVTDYMGYTIADTLTGDGASSQHKVRVSSISGSGGLRTYYGTVEAKTGSLNNIWVGDDGWGAGIDLNTSTGAVSASTAGYLRGWKVEKIDNSWWRVHILYATPPTDATDLTFNVALGNGTVGTSPPTFTTSGTMHVARAYLMPAEAVNPELLADILPTLASASSASSVTLDANEPASNDVMKNRQICFISGYVATAQTKAFTICSCIVSYNGTTKVAGLSPSTYTTLSSNYKYRIGGLCLPDVNVTSMANNVITADKIAADSIGASEITADAIGSSEIAADAIGASEIAASAITSSEFAQSAADKTWNTAPQDGSASTALGYLDAIKKYVANKMSIVGSNYTIYKDDQTTTYATGTTNSAGRDPD